MRYTSNRVGGGQALSIPAPIAAVLLIGACARTPQIAPISLAPQPAPSVAACEGCSAVFIAPEMSRTIERRIAELGTLRQSCAVYGEALERSYRERRISIRPFMWRVGTRLVSGEATAAGDLLLAREIDSLNVGVRTMDDVMWTMEHEAAHIAFNISSGDESNEDRVNAFVRECNAAPGSDRARLKGGSPRPG